MDEHRIEGENGLNEERNIGNDIDGDVPNGFEKDIPVNNGMSDEEEQEAREKKFRRAAGLGFTAGVILGATGGISVVDAQKSAEKRNSVDSNPPLTQQYDNTQQQYEDENTAKVELLDSSIGSGLDDQGFIKREEIANEIDVEEIKDIIDITKWNGYKLESVEEIEPTYFVPSKEAHEKGFLTPLYVIPLHEDGLLDLADVNSPVLKYDFAPGTLSSFEVGKIYTVVTKDGKRVRFGGPSEVGAMNFNAEFFLLLEVKLEDHESLNFSNEAEGSTIMNYYETVAFADIKELSDEEINRMTSWQSNININIGNRIIKFNDLIKFLDPVSLDIGSKINQKEAILFVSILSNINSELVSNDSIVKKLIDYANEKNSAGFEKSDTNDNESNKGDLSKIDSLGNLYLMNYYFPELDLPFDAFGLNWTKQGIVKAKEGLYNKIEELLFDKNFDGFKIFDIPNDRYTKGGFASFIEDAKQVELHIGQFSTKDFEVGDIILIKDPNNKDLSLIELEYVTIIGKGIKSDGNVFLIGIQNNRYGQGELNVFIIESSNIREILGLEDGENIPFIRSNK